MNSLNRQVSMTQTQDFRYNWILLVIAAVLARLAFLHSGLLWDSAVYVGMGKFLFSVGTSGLWEHIRPPLLPIILGFFWKLNLDSILVYKAISLTFSAMLIWLVCKAGKQENKNDNATGFIAASLIAVSAIIAMMSFQLYTEIPAVVCILGAYLLYKEYDWLAGIMLALAFMFKFPSGIALIPFIIVLTFNKQFKSTIKLCLGFAIALLPYLIINAIIYKNPFTPFLDASSVINNVLGCNVLNYQPFWQYGIWVLTESIIYLFAIPGIVIAVRKKNWLLVLLALLPLIYFAQLHCRDYRYIIQILPFLAILAALSFQKIVKNIHLGLIIIVICAIPGLLALQQQQTTISTQEHDYYVFNSSTDKEIWTSNPMITLYTNKPINKIYYPLYHQNPNKFLDYLKENNSRIWGVFLDNCGGGIVCDTENCKQTQDNTIDFLNTNFKLEYNESYGNCWFTIYS